MSSSSSIDQLICWSLSVKDGDAAELRERATLSTQGGDDFLKATLQAWVQEARGINSDAGLLYVETCHRVEIYAFGMDSDDLVAKWLGPRRVQISPERLKRGVEVVKHLIRVTSSLESEVLGETQITGQIKDAYDKSRSLGLVQGPLDRCIQHSLRCAKKVRSSTDLGQGTVSVAHVAVDGLGDVFDSMESKSALLVGAGSMAQQALERMRVLGISKITWINRSRERILEHPLARDVELGDFSQLAELAWSHSVIVAATSSPHSILDLETLKSAQPQGRRKAEGPRVILDLGLPRNVDPAIHGFHGFYLRNVDEFRDRAEKNSEVRERAVQAAEEIVDAEIESFVKVWNTWERGPMIGELFKGVESLRQLEMQGQVQLEKNPEIEYIVRSIYSKLMHRLVEELESTEEPLSTQVIETLVRAWRHPDQWLQRNQHPQLKQHKQKQK